MHDWVWSVPLRDTVALVEANALAAGAIACRLGQKYKNVRRKHEEASRARARCRMARRRLADLATGAQAEDWPTRPLTMINPFAAGGPNDVLARLFAQRMGEILGQPVIVENVGGAGGMNGADRVAKAAPDGYTFLQGTVGTQAQNQLLFKKPAYNSTTDFAPVALIVEAPLVLVARKDMPVGNMKEFVAYAKANKDKMQFASAGTGSAIHLGCALMNMVTGLDIVHVPYRGANPAMQDLMSGRVDYLCDIITTAKPQIDAGTVKAIAILTKAALAGAAQCADRDRTRLRRRGLYLERVLPAQGHARRHRAKTQPRDRGGHEDAERAADAGKRRPHLRQRRPHHAGISGEIRAKRDREMGGADQGRRHQCGLSGIRQS